MNLEVIANTGRSGILLSRNDPLKGGEKIIQKSFYPSFSPPLFFALSSPLQRHKSRSLFFSAKQADFNPKTFRRDLIVDPI